MFGFGPEIFSNIQCERTPGIGSKKIPGSNIQNGTDTGELVVMQ